MKVYVILSLTVLCAGQNGRPQNGRPQNGRPQNGRPSTMVDGIVKQAASHLIAPKVGSPFTFSADRFLSNQRLIGRLIRTIYRLARNNVFGNVLSEASNDNSFLRLILTMLGGKSPNLKDVARIVEGHTPDPFVSLQHAFKNQLTKLMVHKDDVPILPDVLKGFTGFNVLKFENSKFAVDTNVASTYVDSHAATIPDFLLKNLTPILNVFLTIRNEPSNADKIMQNLVKIDFDALLGRQPKPTKADKTKMTLATSLISFLAQNNPTSPWRLQHNALELIGQSQLPEMLNAWKQLYILMSKSS